MKKTLLSLFILLSFLGYSQTTEEEYNYLSKGYRIQLESGLDMKKGYKFSYSNTQKFNLSDGMREIETKWLLKDGSLKPCAILLICKRYRGTSIVATDYLCLPANNSSQDIWRKFLEDYNRIFNGSSNNINAMMFNMFTEYSRMVTSY